MKRLDWERIKIIKLNEDTLGLTAGFECGGDEDLDEFLKEDALGYFLDKLAVTYLVSYGGVIVGFFCLSNDAIKVNEEDLEEYYAKGKRLPNYPAIKIGRLAVSKDYQGQGIGSYIIKHVIGRAVVHSQEVGCRYLTVDSYDKADNLNFYNKKNRFTRLVDGRLRKNVPLYLDILKN